MFCKSLLVLLYFFFWPLCFLFFYDIRILITSLWYLQALVITVCSNFVCCAVCSWLCSRTWDYTCFQLGEQYWFHCYVVRKGLCLETFSSLIMKCKGWHIYLWSRTYGIAMLHLIFEGVHSRACIIQYMICIFAFPCYEMIT